MIVIAGGVIVRDNKVLMVKEAQKKCYEQWNFPAGHVDELEKITDAAIREIFEETGCRVKLTGVLPIYCADAKDGQTRIHIRFTADILEENIKFDTEEILEVKWIDIEELKNMTIQELRAYDTNIQFIKDFEDKKIYPLEIFSDAKYNI